MEGNEWNDHIKEGWF